MTGEPTEEARVCAVCTKPLTFIRDAGEAREHGRWVHMSEEFGGTRTHVVVPVSFSEVESVNAACDFCLADHADEWTVVAWPFVLLNHDNNLINYSSLWAACTSCKVLVEEGQWRALVKRAVGEYYRRDNRVDTVATTAGLQVLYYHLRRNLILVRDAAADDYTERDFAPSPDGL